MTSPSSAETPRRRPALTPVAVLMNVWVYGAVVSITLSMAVLSPLLLLLSFLPARGSLKRSVRIWIWVYGRLWTWLIRPFVRLRCSGLDRIPAQAPCILVINHLSFFDTFFMGALPVYDVALTLRSWPFRMFWYSLFMKMARYLDLESSDWTSVLANCNREFQEKASILFFPEGHRSRDGRLQRFHSGAFRLAIETGRPIVPLCITGTDQLLPPGSFSLRPCCVHFEALDPVDPAGFENSELGHSELRKLVKQRLADRIAGISQLEKKP